MTMAQTEKNSLYTVDVRLVALKRLNVLSRAHVPHIGLFITALITHTQNRNKEYYGCFVQIHLLQYFQKPMKSQRPRRTTRFRVSPPITTTWITKKHTKTHAHICLAHPRDKSVSSFRWGEVQRQDISCVTMETLQQLPALDIPQGTCAIATAGQELKDTCTQANTPTPHMHNSQQNKYIKFILAQERDVYIFISDQLR